MIDRRVAHRLTKEIEDYDGPVFYISHHDVLRPESKTTPCRIVFNSSANFHGDVLNEYNAKGPDMLNNLLGVLLRFREEPVAIIGDIPQMFHSIDIPVLDQMTHQFLWRDLDEQREPDTYVMTAVKMGDRPSGTMAIATLRKTAEMSKDEFPSSSETILNNSYMDDIPETAGSAEEAQKITSEIDKILNCGGFKINGWIMSGQDQGQERGFQAQRLEDQHLVQVLTGSKPDIAELERVLGMGWDPFKDVLCYRVKLNFSKKKRKVLTQPNLSWQEIPAGIPEVLTKRMVLSQVNGIYGPMGLVAPFMVRAKIMLRKLWGRDEKLDWDDAMPEREWVTFFEELFKYKEVEFPRCIKPSNAIGDPTLAIFSDGSGDAYGAVAYSRWMMKDGTYKAQLIAGKNRIAPVKIVDILHLELSGAVIAKRLRVFIQTEVRYTFTAVYHIVDSEIVKAMISKESYGFNTFAANQIGELQQKTDPQEWFPTAGDLNIADWVTRGKSPEKLGPCSIWQSSPEFLKQPVEEWPVSSQANVEKLPECYKTVMTTHAKEI